MLTKFRRIDLKEEKTWKAWLKWDYNIKMNTEWMDRENMESTALANDRDIWWSIAKTVINH